MKTRAAVIDQGKTSFEIRELEIDEPRVGEVVVKFVASGLCHSDMHLLDGVIQLPRYPYVPGHEGSGIVESVGPGVQNLAVGDHVVCSFVPSCGTCRYCATGHSNLCDLTAHAVTGDRPDGSFRYHDDKGVGYGSACMLGTFSERATVHERSLVKVDPWIPLEPASLLACGVPTGWGSAVNSGGVRVGDTTVIYGVGGIGINAVQGAVHAGARFVVVVDPVELKRETALQFGATHAFADAEAAAAKVDELTWGRGAEQAVIAVGVVDQKVVRDAFDIVGKTGTVVITGQSHHEEVTIQIPSALLVRSEKVIRGSQFGSSNAQHDIVKMSRMYDGKKLKLDELITKRYTLDQINQGYEDLRDGKIIRGIIVHE